MILSPKASPGPFSDPRGIKPQVLLSFSQGDHIFPPNEAEHERKFKIFKGFFSLLRMIFSLSYIYVWNTGLDLHLFVAQI